MRRKHTNLSINQKLKIIKHLQNKTKTARELAKDYSCCVSTINRILRNEGKIRNIAVKNPKCKRLRNSIHPDVDKALTDWAKGARLQNTILSTSVILKKAQQFATKFKSDFKPNSNWVYRWKKRENMRSKQFHDDTNSSDELSEEITDTITAKDMNNSLKEEPKDEAFHKIPTPETRETNEELDPDCKKAIEALLVLRKYMVQRNLCLDDLDRLEENVLSFRKSSTEAAASDEICICPSSLCHTEYDDDEH